jgi:integrase
VWPYCHQIVTIPLAPRTAPSLGLAIGERLDGPIFRRADGQRLDRHGASRIVRRITKRARITKPISPHILRHAFITAALDAGVLPESATSRQPRSTVSKCCRG